jgi:hypothetical protein
MPLFKITRLLPRRTGSIADVDLERIEQGSICFDLYTPSSTVCAVRFFREAF